MRSTFVQLQKMGDLVEEYQWRDRRGDFHKIEDMETRHLFHVVRMVWDYSMPKEIQTSFLNRYNFPLFYNRDYMATTVRLMLPILLTRRDLTDEMRFWLDFMDQALRKHKQIKFVQLIGHDNVAQKDSNS